MTITIQKELEQLDDNDILDISEKIDDYLVPVEVAAKLKKVSKSAIFKAIQNGVLRKVEGVTLTSLREYKVSNGKRVGGNIRAMRMLEKKLEKLEKLKGEEVK